MNLLVCGTRLKSLDYRRTVHDALDSVAKQHGYPSLKIVEGCCPDSADAFAESWALYNRVPILHFPSEPGNYLKRNIEMVNACDEVLAFWDRFSYGTAHTIANALLLKKKVTILTVGGKT